MTYILTVAATVLAVAALADESRLMPCPDCGKIVSKLAFMCPNCGCKGEVIAEAAKSIPEVATGDVLDVDCGTCAAHALPVEMSGNIW